MLGITHTALLVAMVQLWLVTGRGLLGGPAESPVVTHLQPSLSLPHWPVET